MSSPDISAILAEAEANRRRERAAQASAVTVSTPASTGDYTTGTVDPGNSILLDANGKIPSGYLYPPSAGSIARSFELDQTSPATVWDVVHNLGGYPVPVIADSNGDQMNGSVRWVDENHLTVTFGRPKVGTLRVSL